MPETPPFTKAAVPHVAIAISNVCNLNCPMCETQNSTLARGNMSFEMFQSVVSALKPLNVTSVVLHNVNEPILHPRIFDFLNHLEENRIHVWISSNGQALDQFVNRARKQARLPRRLVFRYSIEGGTREVYEEMRAGGSFDKLIANLELMERFCAERGVRYEAGCNYVLTTKTAREVGAFHRIFKRFIPLKDTTFSLVAGNSVSGTNEYIRANALAPLVPALPCSVPFTQMSVHYDGKVSLCCVDFNQEGIVGRFPEQRLDEIWHGELFEQYRQAHNEENSSGLPPLCQRCFSPCQNLLHDEINDRIREILADCDKDENALNQEAYDYLLTLTRPHAAAAGLPLPILQ